MVLHYFCAGVYRINIYPPSGTSLYVLPGGSLTFNCSVVNSNTGVQAITDWRANNVHVSGVFRRDQVDYSGSFPLSQPLGSITTTRNALKIIDYNLQDISLACQLGDEVFARYSIFLYRKLLKALYILPLLCWAIHSRTSFIAELHNSQCAE